MNTLARRTIFFVVLPILGVTPVLANDGLTVPPPVFQLGDTPSQPLPDKSPEATAFVNFFNETYMKDGNTIPLLGKQDVVWFPPQHAGDTSLELVVRATPGNPPNCNPGDAGYPPQGYPLVCREDFSTGQFCQACHDSALFVEGGGLPEMMYVSDEEHDQWLVNWSQYGDWSTSIMRLATRDPIWQAQIETETNTHPFADPAVIQDVCFSCHGEMGERQLKFDHGAGQTFCTDMFYATLPGILSSNERGRDYPFTGDCGAPINGMSVSEHPEIYAKYGSLARDGVSCETCHRIGPRGGAGDWDGEDVSVFYGPTNTYNVSQRQTANPVPLEHEFTATFDYDMNNIMAPDPVATLDLSPMKGDDSLNLSQAVNEKDQISYLRQSIVCGTCHVLIVPQIPTAFRPDGPLPTAQDAPYYKRPKSCPPDQTSFAPATRGQYGNPITDQCVALGYEQATYLEWINSGFASEKDNGDTCQGCHMPLVTDPAKPNDHTAIMAQSTKGLSPKRYRRHRLMGINLPVFEMFMQFPDVLGVSAFSANVPDYAPMPSGEDVAVIQNYLMNGQSAIVEQATSQANGNGLMPNSTEPDPQAAAEIVINSSDLSAAMVTADLTIVNNSGHKFPSGAGFRRAFLRFEVLDAGGKVLWVSGQTNPFGAICNGSCTENADGTYNLLASETPDGNPRNLQPHRAIIYAQDQAQIYEVQAVDDTGRLTSKTLALFHDAKDNRLLPRGFMSAEELGCEADPMAGTEIFGIKQCSAAYATEPQLDPLTLGSAIRSDPHYSDSKLAGSDTIKYQIPRADIAGVPASIRVSMQYQTIPPGYLAQRFKDGYDSAQDKLLPATERSVYLTSHLNTNLELVSENPDNPDLLFSQNWTTTIHQAEATLTASDSGAMLLAPAYPSVLDQSVERGASLPFVFFQRQGIPFTYSGTGQVLMAARIDGTGNTFVDDAVTIAIHNRQGTLLRTFMWDYSREVSGQITPKAPLDISGQFPGPGDYDLSIEFQDRIPAYLGASDFYLVPKAVD